MVVREFCINGKDGEDCKAKVRRKVISFDNKTINKFNDLLHIPSDEFSEFMEDPPYKEIIWELCRKSLGIRWTIKDNENNCFLINALAIEEKTHTFTLAKLISTTHHIDVQ